LEHVTLLPNTHLDGGTLNNAQVMDGVTLTNLTLGDNTPLSSNVIIGEGVRFGSNNQIPIGTNLTAAFSSGNTLSLQTEVISGPVLTLLQQLNQIPDLQNNQWQFEQNPVNGQLQLTMAGIRFALLPISVMQVGTDQPAGMTINPDDSIRYCHQLWARNFGATDDSRPGGVSTGIRVGERSGTNHAGRCGASESQ